MAGLASKLQGKTIDKWQVLRKKVKTKEDDSGAFSSCYFVKNIDSGDDAFLKTLNFEYAFKATGTTSTVDRINEITSEFKYENDLLQMCSGAKMSRVVRAIDHGEYTEASAIYPVPYIVFEVAEQNLKVETKKQDDLFWRLRVFHGALVGLSQLHRVKVAHQDLKPSNILIFGEAYSKISDLGRATTQNNESGHEHGDLGYAPIEFHYQYFSPDWNTRRLGTDFFMMGGILCFLLCKLNFLSLLNQNLEPKHRPRTWKGTYSEVLPYLQRSFSISLAAVAKEIPSFLKEDLVAMLSDLCNPEPEKRGRLYRANRSYNQYDLQPYISKANLLWNRAKRIR